MSAYQSMVKKIISSIEALESVKSEFSEFGIKIDDGDTCDWINRIAEIIYDLNEMLEENENCDEIFEDIAEILEGVCEGEADDPKAIHELEDALYELEESGNKTACTIISSYIERYKNAIAEIGENVNSFAECVNIKFD